MLFLLRALSAALVAQTALALVPVGHTPSGKPIFQAPPGSRVQQSSTNMDVFAPNGSLIHVFENVVPTLKKSPSTLARRQDLSATEAFTALGPSDTIQSFNTSFFVPPKPTTFESQIMFLGAGVEPLDDDGVPFAMVRAALQYGGSPVSGGPFWTVVINLEFLPDGGFLEIFDPTVNTTVQAGDHLATSVTFDPEGPQIPGFPTLFWYIAAFDNLPDILTLEVGWEVPPQIASLRMEEEGVFQPTDYPTGSFVFEQVNLNLTTGFPSISWSTNVDPSTDVEVKVESDGSQNAQVAIVFPDSY
ncbi:hypothetical protein C8F01DRAFT_1152927 [Mycena amicta]|nr:hypothetical protein C8F01DRAFT_1152927 [Mycena amicta]